MAEKKELKVFKFFLIFVFLLLVFIQAILPSFSPKGNFPSEFQNVIVRFELIIVIGFLIGLFQLLLSVELVIKEKNQGFYAQLIINIFNILFCLQGSILRGEVTAIPGIPMSLVSIGLSYIIYKQNKNISKSMEVLHHYAFIDELTGLPNRKERMTLINELISGSEKKPAFSLVMINLDNFKMINDSLGHQIGDVMMIEIVNNLRDFIKAPDSIGRIGGDEFLVIIEGAKTEIEIETYVKKMSAIINKPFYYKEKDYRMTASFGISRYPKDSVTASELMQQVDIALFRAKSHGKNQMEFFDEKMQITLENQLNIERKLSSAIENKELYIEFQPQYKLPSGELRGFEVLARWCNPIIGQVSPTSFIPMAESNGLIVSIGKWIMKEACFGFEKLVSEYKIPPTLSINVSVVQFQDPEFIPYVKSIIEASGIEPKYLEFEITESVCITSPEVARHILTELKLLGIKISLDDFGTGYSSLSYLRTLPLDVVKIDKSFIEPIGKIPNEKNIVKTIIDMAHQLDLEVIAEGIEEKIQYDYLIQNNCDYVQGNYIGKPLPIFAL